ncbi:HEAT repeat domain-containing protein [Mesobacillus jeotgali]|uniref:HEAT repeat domain-containing protein n=1 Tax=Mesobacillus jeotgali TaxID=129985 RepID=A0ABY9VK66_9BACI|nr:HEAT repeat domain-containing protein [Mesobacillus jeotgali]WNF23933.1 HEAT repeat domain-containing protein [Mesobacillus jeotgali]
MIHDDIKFLLTVFEWLMGILLLLLFYLIARKAAEIRLRKKVEENKTKMNDKLLHSILTGDFLRSLQADTKAKKLAMEELLSHYSDILEGTEEKQNLNLLAETRLGEGYRRALSSYRWSTRMNALFHIEAFHMESVKEDIQAMLKRRRVTKEEKIKGLSFLAQIQDKEIYRLVTEEYKELSYLEYRNILSRLDEKSLEQFMLGYHSSQLQLKFAIIDLVGLKKNLAYLNFVESTFSNSSGEERVRALKALAAIGHTNNAKNFLPLLSSPNWEERMLSARLAGEMKCDEAIHGLVQLLQDPSWWVRSQAGQSITRFPQGKKILQQVIDSSSDSFAKDMAWEWMNKGVYQS